MLIWLRRKNNWSKLSATSNKRWSNNCTRRCYKRNKIELQESKKVTNRFRNGSRKDKGRLSYVVRTIKSMRNSSIRCKMTREKVIHGSAWLTIVIWVLVEHRWEVMIRHVWNKRCWIASKMLARALVCYEQSGKQKNQNDILLHRWWNREAVIHRSLNNLRLSADYLKTSIDVYFSF